MARSRRRASVRTFRGGRGAAHTSHGSSFTPPSAVRLRAEGLTRVVWSFFIALTVCLLPVLLPAATPLVALWGVAIPLMGAATSVLLLRIEMAGEGARTDPQAGVAARRVLEGRLVAALFLFLVYSFAVRAGFVVGDVCRDTLWLLAILAVVQFFRLRRWAALVEAAFLIAAVAIVQTVRGNAAIVAAGVGVGLATFARGVIESLQGLAREGRALRTAL